MQTLQTPSLAVPPATVPPEPSALPTHLVGGLRFHHITMQRTLDLLDHWIHEGTPRHICLANAYTIAFCRRNPEMTDLINHADLVLADGMSIVWGARWVGVKFPERVAGPDLMERLCAQAAQRGRRVFLLGSSTETLSDLQQLLKARYPKLAIAGAYSPSVCERFSPEETSAMIDLVNAATPDILFVSLSAPKQEIWIAENLRQLRVPVCIGVGAAFDFLSGRIPRAPQAMQNLGLEWLFRLWREPRRLWKRYLLGNAVFLLMLAKGLTHRRLSPRKES
jgi:N-acetylglucosaminyldiphosphoundecaprenol N-acetyl-beta-D-mannosaminyltransferase